MPNWLDLSSTSNMLKSAYIQGFVDISGGDFIARNGKLLIAGDVSFNSKLYVAGPTTFNGAVSGITSSMVGLGNVDNTSDANKPVSTATLTALNLKANTVSPTFTGILTTPTIVSGDASFNNSLSVGGNTIFAGTLTAPTIVSSDASFNNSLSVGGNTIFKARVDICGNLYAQYPVASIPAEAIIGGAGGGSSIDLTADIIIHSINAGRGAGSELSNTVFGIDTLQLNDGGTNNSGFGSEALKTMVDGTDNVGIGSKALFLNAGGRFNTSVGSSALTTSTSNHNSALGYQSLRFTSSGANNTAIGSRSGSTNQTGGSNTFIGYLADCVGTGWSNSTAIGANAKFSESNAIVLGTVTETVKIPGRAVVTGNVSASAYLTTSDYRIKENIVSLADCSFDIGNLNPIQYHNKLTNKQDIGFLAHELQAELPFLVNGEKDGKNMQSVNYTGLIGLLVKEIKDLKEKILPKLNTMVEAPKSELIYRGSIQLINGVAQVNIDTQFGMPEGTFVSLTRDVNVFTSNETGWNPVIGSVSDNILTIQCKVDTVSPTVNYLIIAAKKV